MFRTVFVAVMASAGFSASACAAQTSPAFTPDLQAVIEILILHADEVALVDESYQGPARRSLVELLAGRVLGAAPAADSATLAWADGGCELISESGARQSFLCQIDLLSVTRAGRDAIGLPSELESLARLTFTLSGDTRTDASDLNWVVEGGIVRVVFAG